MTFFKKNTSCCADTISYYFPIAAYMLSRCQYVLRACDRQLGSAAAITCSTSATTTSPKESSGGRLRLQRPTPHLFYPHKRHTLSKHTQTHTAHTALVHCLHFHPSFYFDFHKKINNKNAKTNEPAPSHPRFYFYF